MKIEHNVDLKRMTTFNMGGIAANLYIPESEQELIDLIRTDNPHYFMGGGSNIIINTRIFDNVVSLREFNPIIENQGDGVFFVGGSVRLQKLIKTINDAGYGGIEYLYSVPGLVGGAVAMNAGRGKSFSKCISDYIEKVKIHCGGKTYWVEKKDCNFSYRMSSFKNSNAIILCVKFKFERVDSIKCENLRTERIELCKKKQDNSAPNFGTVFCESNKIIMQLFKYLPIGSKKGIMYSKKTANWMLNNGGSFESAVLLIERVKKIHRVFGQKCRTEVIIWE